MRTRNRLLFFCAAVSGMIASAAAPASAVGAAARAGTDVHGRGAAETFVVHAGRDGETAVITIPVGAVFDFSADRAEALADYADPKVEAMRLSGDVRILVKGASRPIRIEADRVVLELAADEAPRRAPGAAPIGGLRSSEIIRDGRDAQTFVGNVSFTVPTMAGNMRIQAGRVEYRGASSVGAASAPKSHAVG